MGRLINADALQEEYKSRHNGKRLLLIDVAPTVHPKMGKWLADNRPGGSLWMCNCCKFPSKAFAANVLYKYCPHCGAKMEVQDGTAD